MGVPDRGLRRGCARGGAGAVTNGERMTNKVTYKISIEEQHGGSYLLLIELDIGNGKPQTRYNRLFDDRKEVRRTIEGYRCGTDLALFEPFKNVAEQEQMRSRLKSEYEVAAKGVQ